MIVLPAKTYLLEAYSVRELQKYGKEIKGRVLPFVYESEKPDYYSLGTLPLKRLPVKNPDSSHLYFNYSIDCELPLNTVYTEDVERRSFFHGSATWEFAEASVHGFVAQMEGLGVGGGATLFVYPDVARHQRSLYRGLADAGFEIALHLNGLRYSRLKSSQAKWLGEMPYAEQKSALRMAKQDLEDVVSRPVLGYRACYGSANDDTFPICEELGFEWTSNSSHRYRPEFFACWRGSWPYAHHTNRKCKLVVGDMPLYEIPVTTGLRIFYDEKIQQPLDLRVETPPTVLGDKREKFRAVVEENLIEMELRSAPVRAVIGASHNTNQFNDPSCHQAQNLDWLVKHARELAAQFRLDFTPASFREIVSEARRIDAY